jgi:TetR/AcrR family transcriptional regulator, transcriptional repressor for nem operon
MTKAERTRAFIIEKAAPIFNTKGYAGTSMADLTAATGLTKGAIYGNFENKDEVALAVYEYNLSFVVKGLTEAMEPHANAIDRLRAMAGFYRGRCEHVVTRGGCPILNTAVESADCHPQLKQRSSATLTSWKETIEKIVESGKQRGEIRPDANGLAFAAAFIALIEGGIMLTKALSDRSLVNSCIDRIEVMIDSELVI